MTATALLGTYLNDHLGGAHAGVEMARQLEKDAQGEPGAEQLGPLAKQVEEDLETLQGLVELVGATMSPVKQAAGWVAEKAHRLGVGEPATGSPHLSLLLAAESLSLGVEGKICLWLALTELVPSHPQLGTVDLAGLVERARDQRRRLETVRLAAARRAFATVE